MVILIEKLIEIIARFSLALSRQSIIFTVLGKVQLGRHRPFDDRVHFLKSRPLGMFIYNLRFLFLCSGLLYLALFSYSAMRSGSSIEASKCLFILSVVWALSAGTTVGLHRRFVRRLETWARTLELDDFPRLFDTYFLIDFVGIVLIVASGYAAKLPLSAFNFLIIANLVVYAAYARLAEPAHRLIRFAFYLQLIICLSLLPFSGQSARSDWWKFLYVAPLFGMLIVSLWSVMMISWLRAAEHEATVRRLTVLGELEYVLSEKLRSNIIDARKTSTNRSNPERILEAQIAAFLEILCQLGQPLWYRSAMIWFKERHQDRGILLLRGPSFPKNRSRSFPRELQLSYAGLLGTEKQAILHSSMYQTNGTIIHTPGITPTVDAPAAFLPLSDRIGSFALYGDADSEPPQRQDASFLRSCGSILTSGIEQWESWCGESALQEMDELFKCSDLTSVWPKAATLMCKYLGAVGCMIIFRPDPQAREMHVIAKEGFNETIYKHNLYEVGVGQTGKCAETGEPIRWDNVPAHRDEFDEDLLRGLERALGASVQSWLAIPIGSRGSNYGVIKVVNRLFGRNWFSERDQKLGTALALRLRVIIQRFLDLDRMLVEASKANEIAKEAKADREKAEKTALQRQQDLMVMTHQLQSPLTAISAAISFLQTRNLAHDIRLDLEHTRALTEDAILLCYGTSTCLALIGGREQLFAAQEVNVTEEMRALCERLQWTNARRDLSFSYKEDPAFPAIKINRETFTSVLFSLIHNAVKYADQHSEVTLECGFEVNRGTAALKVKSYGEPIDESEKELIFEMFKRGKEVERTGRHHGGVGLGLFVARTLMRAVGGNLTVELSRNDRRRAIFVMHFPG